MGLHLHLDPWRHAVHQPNAVVNESSKMLNPIQNRSNLQLSGWFGIFHTRFSTEAANNSQPLFLYLPKKPLGAAQAAQRSARGVLGGR